MKIIVNRQEALALAKSAESIAPVKTAIEELRCVLLEASPDNLLTMAATNIETALERRMPAEVQESGSILLNAKLLSNMLGLLGGNAMLNLFTGGRKVTNLKLKKNQYEQVLQNYYKTNLTAIQEVNDSLVSLKQDDEKYKTNLDVYKLEQEDFKYSTHKYDEGLISYLDLLQRRENLLTINKLVVSNKLDCNIDYIGLYKATGAKLQ